MTSNVDMIDTKVVVAEVIYNFEVVMFFIGGQLYSQIFILSLCILKFNFFNKIKKMSHGYMDYTKVMVLDKI